MIFAVDLTSRQAGFLRDNYRTGAPSKQAIQAKFVLKKGFWVYYPCFRSCSQIYAGRIASRAQAPGISRQLLSASITMRADLAREASLFLIAG